MNNILQELSRFAVETKYDELPELTVHEAKRSLLDSIGCAFASLSTDRGRMSASLARMLGGPPESSIIGTSDKVSCCNAALANGELILAIDYCSIIPPGGHIPTFVIPAPLVMSERAGSSGKDLILAIVIGYEIAARVASALPFFCLFEGTEGQNIRWAPRWGKSFCNFGAAAAAAKILNLDKGKMSHALGIAGHLCQLPTQARFSFGTYRPLMKYGAPGWQSTGAVMAALLAEMGYTGDTAIFDTEQGFWKFSGFEEWKPSRIMEGIGEIWYTPGIIYKQYPCCGMLQTALDCFRDIIDQNNLIPEDIESVEVFAHPTIELPAFQNNDLFNISDAQFNAAYVIAVAAHRVRVGIEWQDSDTMRNPKIQEFMKKVRCRAYPGFGKKHLENPSSNIALVEVVARGATFREERLHPKGTPVADARMTDEELVDKFRHNASRILTQDKIDGTINGLLELEAMRNITELMKQVTL